jgi:uncharacterized protein YjlB
MLSIRSTHVASGRGGLLRVKRATCSSFPAGVGHRRVGGDEGLKVIGAYQRGQSRYDMKRNWRAVPQVPVSVLLFAFRPQ